MDDKYKITLEISLSEEIGDLLKELPSDPLCIDEYINAILLETKDKCGIKLSAVSQLVDLGILNENIECGDSYFYITEIGEKIKQKLHDRRTI